MKKLTKLILASGLLLNFCALSFAQEAESVTDTAATTQLSETAETTVIEKKEVKTVETAKTEKKLPDTEEGTDITKRNGLENKNAIGAYFLGSQSPIGGIQYERRFNNVVSMKSNGYIFYNTQNSFFEHSLDYNINAEFDFRMYEYAWRESFASRLYAFVLVGHRGFVDNNSYYDENLYNYVYVPGDYHATAIGSIGFGFDLFFYDHLSIPLQVGFMGSFPNDPYAGLCIGTAVRYSF